MLRSRARMQSCTNGVAASNSVVSVMAWHGTVWINQQLPIVGGKHAPSKHHTTITHKKTRRSGLDARGWGKGLFVNSAGHHAPVRVGALVRGGNTFAARKLKVRTAGARDADGF